jgi:hypothetical protein
MIRYKIMLSVVLLSTVLLHGSNPLDKLGMKPITDRAYVAGMIRSNQATWAEMLGYSNDGLYIRLLLTEFYIARCGIAASAFRSGALEPENIWPGTLNQFQGWNVQPGGFNTSTVDNFFKIAEPYVRVHNPLVEARTALEPASNFYHGTSSTPPNPLDTFAGIIIIPDVTMGTITIGENSFNVPGFFPYTPPTKSSSNSTSITMELKNAAITNPLTKTISKPTSLCSLTLKAWPSDRKYNWKPVTFRLQSLVATVMGQTITPEFYAATADLTPDQKKMASFFKNAPNNPWAIVIHLNATPDGKPTVLPDGTKQQKYTVHPTIPAFVQLNTYEFFENTQTFKTIKTAAKTSFTLLELLQMPTNLYNSVQGVHGTAYNYATPTGRLLRAITNGYLTSWKYKPLVSPHPGFQPNGRTPGTADDIGIASDYPVPGNGQFANAPNNKYTMLFALAACLHPLKNAYIPSSSFKDILTIIKDQYTPLGSYMGAPKKSSAYRPVLPLSKTTITYVPHTTPTKKGFFKNLLSNLAKPFRKFKNLLFSPGTLV